MVGLAISNTAHSSSRAATAPAQTKGTQRDAAFSSSSSSAPAQRQHDRQHDLVAAQQHHRHRVHSSPRLLAVDMVAAGLAAGAQRDAQQHRGHRKADDDGRQHQGLGQRVGGVASVAATPGSTMGTRIHPTRPIAKMNRLTA
jgi:hypothetical protein